MKEMTFTESPVEFCPVWLDSNGFFWGQNNADMSPYEPDFCIMTTSWMTAFDIIQEIKTTCLYNRRIGNEFSTLINKEDN